MTFDPKLWEGHTPAPWNIEPGTMVIWSVVDPDAPGTYGYGVPLAKAEIPYGNPPAHIADRRKAASANAALIAAAPEIEAERVRLAARVSVLEGENRKLVEILLRVERDAEEPGGDYLFGLRCGVEDRGIHDRYEAAEYGWSQAFDYVASALSGAGDESRATLGDTP